MKLSQLIQKTTLPAQLGWVKASARRMLLELRLAALRERLSELSDEEVTRLLDVTRPFVPPAPWVNDSIVKGLHQIMRTLGGSLEPRGRLNGREPEGEPPSLRSELHDVLAADGDAPRVTPFDVGAWQTALRTTAGAAALAQTMALHVRRAITAGPPRAHDWTTASLGMVADILEACHSRLLEFGALGADPAELAFAPLKAQATPEKARVARAACAFCGKTQPDVETLVSGPGVHICNECVDLCIQLVAAERGGPA